jgi:hypothetical protein
MRTSCEIYPGLGLCELFYFVCITNDLFRQYLQVISKTPRARHTCTCMICLRKSGAEPVPYKKFPMK